MGTWKSRYNPWFKRRPWKGRKSRVGKNEILPMRLRISRPEPVVIPPLRRTPVGKRRDRRGPSKP